MENPALFSQIPKKVRILGPETVANRAKFGYNILNGYVSAILLCAYSRDFSSLSTL